MAISNHFALLEQAGVPSARAKGCGDRGAYPLGASSPGPWGKAQVCRKAVMAPLTDMGREAIGLEMPPPTQNPMELRDQQDHDQKVNTCKGP